MSFIINPYQFGVASNPAFQIQVDTTNAGSASDTFVLPLDGVSTYNFDIDWGDESSETVTVNTDQTHVYASGGIYTISITGTFPRIYFNNAGDKAKLLVVVNWGDIEWNNMSRTFYGCSNLDISATDIPDFSNVSDMEHMFYNCTNLTGGVQNFDTSSVTAMTNMFRTCTAFNQDVSHFDTSKVVSFNQMFFFASIFDQNISNWNIESLLQASNFMSGAAFSNTNYDLLLVAWEAQVEKPNVSFHAGSAEYSYGNPSIARAALVANGWTITDGGFITLATVDFTGAFEIQVDTTKAGSASDTFVLPLDGASTYDFVIDWGDSNREHVTVNTDQTHVYSTGGTYNIKILGTFPRIYFNNAGDKLKLLDVVNWGDIEWGSMSGAFYGCSNSTFTASDTPDLSNVTSAYRMFRGCSSFNQSISQFDTSNITNMEQMFYDCTLFNQSVSSFDTSGVTTMKYMFGLCTNFDQSVSNFDTSLVNNMYQMFTGCGNFNQSVSSFDTSKVTIMEQMFYNCTLFNQSVSNFNTSLVNNMYRMFRACANFNQSVSNFDTSSVTTMEQMFYNCTLFNQDISSWDITNLTDATSMLQLDTSFSNTNYDLLLVAWEAQTEQPNVSFHAGTAQYSAGAPATARTALVANGWTVTDGGQV